MFREKGFRFIRREKAFLCLAELFVRFPCSRDRDGEHASHEKVVRGSGAELCGKQNIEAVFVVRFRVRGDTIENIGRF